MGKKSGRCGDADVRVPLTRRVVYIGYDEREQKSWSGCMGFLILLGAFALIGFCGLTWCYLRDDDPWSYKDSNLQREDSVDPCDDFYSHVCGRWNVSGSKKYRFASAVEEIDARNLLRLESYLREYRKDDPVGVKLSDVKKHPAEGTSGKELTDWGRFMLETYESCKRERGDSVDRSETVRFVKVIAEPLLRNSSVGSLDEALLRTHHKLIQTGLFSWNLILDFRNRTIVQAFGLSPPKHAWSSDLNFSLKHDLMAYMTEVLLLLGGDEQHVLRRSAEVADFAAELKNRLNATASIPLANVKSLNFHEFSAVFDFIDFAAYFEPVSLSDAVFVVDNWKYFLWMQEYARKNGGNTRAMTDFLTWSAVDFFVPYMPEEFVRIRRKYTGKTTGKAKVEGTHVCANAMKKSMNFAASSFFMDKALDRESRAMVNDVIENVKNSYTDFLHTLHRRHAADPKWLTGLDAVLKNMEIGVPANLQKIYREPIPFNLTETSFPHRLLSAMNFSKTRMVSHIDEVPLGFLFLQDFLELNGFFISLPLTVINLGILTPPLFDREQSLSSNYAGLGYIVAHELAHSVDHLVNASSIRNHLGFVSQCLHEQYGNSQRAVDVRHEDFADNVGIRVAYNAFLQHGGSPSEADKRDFFVRFGQFFCDDGTSFNPDRNIHHSPYKHRVNMPLSNFPAFSDVFSCSNSSAMNNNNKCNM